METKSEVEGSGTRREFSPSAMLERVAERVASADARTIYGAPIERNGMTVIPVARVRYGFGGGMGRKQSAGDEGTGAGGGVNVTPVGYIEMSHDKVRFRRIRTPPSPALVAFGIGLSMLLLSRVLRAAIAAR
jgi:hypothetical protein